MDKDELLFVSWLAGVNTALGRYIARLMDDAAGHGATTYTTSLAEVESELGEELVQLGRVLIVRGGGQQPEMTEGMPREVPPGRTGAGGGA